MQSPLQALVRVASCEEIHHGNATQKDGYTNLEHHLNSLAE